MEDNTINWGELSKTDIYNRADAQVNRGPGPRRILGANNELQVYNPDYQRFEDLNQAAPTFSETLLKVFRGLVAGFVLLCCIYNFVIAIAYETGDWTKNWKVKLQFPFRFLILHYP